MRNFHIKIDKIGRKWITAVVTGSRSTYPVQIDRSQLPQANVGEEMDVCAEFVDLSTQYGRKYQLNIVDKNLAAEEERLQKIKRWWGYLVSNYDNGNGYIYERAITELRCLNCHDYDEQIEEMRRTIENRKEAERAERAERRKAELPPNHKPVRFRIGCRLLTAPAPETRLLTRARPIASCPAATKIAMA